MSETSLLITYATHGLCNKHASLPVGTRGLRVHHFTPSALVPLEVRQAKEGEPYAVRTMLGWTLNGPLTDGYPEARAACHFIQADTGPDKGLEAQVERFWKLDIGQTLAGSVPQMSQDDKRVMEVWNQSIELKDQHYEMDIPFKSTPLDLPDNKVVAERRLQCLGRRLSKNPELHEKYKTGIEDLGPVSKRSLRQDLLLKLRHVNDSSSRFLSLSSKSCLKLHLETGPWSQRVMQSRFQRRG